MTDKKTEALKLALEALEECRRDPRLKYEHPYYDKAITAIREALAEEAHYKKVIDDVQALFEAILEESAIWQAAYETEKGFREQEKQELEAKRKWVGLTDEEKEELDAEYGDDTLAHLDAIEAKLKEKNT